MIQDPNLFLSIGKPIKDEYGHVMGKIASFAVTPSGKFDSVFVEQGDGKFMRHPVEHVKLDGTDVMLLSSTKSEASSLCDQIPLLWRKDQALSELAEKKKISQELYQELHKSFDGALTQLRSEAQVLIEKMEKEIIRCAEEIRTLNYALVHLELEHEIGKIDNQSYNAAFEIIQENFKRVNEEKTDLELTKSKLSNNLLGDIPKPIAQPPEDAKEEAPTGLELPEPPVVVYVKEIGRTGI